MCSLSSTTSIDRERAQPRPRLLHEYFERQAAARPAHTAVESDDEMLTYRQLDRISNQIAHWLKAHGTGPGALVGISMEKSCRLFAGMLGILKSGAGYVPIDPRLPLDRVRSIVDDARIDIVVTGRHVGEQLLLGNSIKVLSLKPNMREVRPYPRTPLNAADTGVTPEDACYVIYTSGSTGRPKGVVIEHRNAVNFVRALDTVYKVGPDDRVYQGFSVAFDASIEEIWAAFAHGGTLVLPPDHVAKSPLDAGEFATKKKVTFFSTVPTFLAMMSSRLPTVRLLVVGGERCPQELVARWAPGRRMLNTYGPTEATVVATAADCIAGEPVTIGKPLPGYIGVVLDGQFNPVGVHEIGELYIGGESVAREYLNLPELTAERFVVNPGNDPQYAGVRMFRTHDIVRITPDGSFQFVGRNDQQVKIRGFRVELSEIETVLMETPSVKAAAVNVIWHGEAMELAAYVVPKSDFEPQDRRDVVERLHKRIPDYMVPRYLDVLDELPTLMSGKVDRKLLPNPQTLLSSEHRVATPAVTLKERAIVEIFERLFGISPIFASDDFFRDLRGHSYIAARVVTELRAKFGTSRICMRDLYAHRTAAHLAGYLESLEIAEASKAKAATDALPADAVPAVHPVGAVGRWACAFFQAITILAVYGVVVAPVVYLMVLGFGVLDGSVEGWRAAEDATKFSLGIWPSWLAISIAAKWIVIGRYKPGRYPVWGLYYLRWWIVTRFQTISWCGIFAGTPLMSLYYRAMGANVGSGCTICTPFCSAFDLISIGKNSSIGGDTQLLGYRIENNYLVLGQVEIGEACFVGVHSNLGLNVVMGDRAALDDMSMLPDGAVMARAETCRGSPAVHGAVNLPAVVGQTMGGWRGILFGALHLGLIYVMGYLLMLAILPGLALVVYSFVVAGPARAVAAGFVAVPLSAVSWLLIVVLVKSIVIGEIRPGTYSLASVSYLRIWFQRYLLDNTRHLLVPIYATMLTPRFLRLLGAKIGRGVEISTVMHVVPDLLEIGNESFLADACIVGGYRIYRGRIELKPNKIGSRTFVGNSALAPPGIELGSNSLIGVMSVPPGNAQPLKDGARWLGSPSFELPNTERADFCVAADERRTYNPSVILVFSRTLMEGLRLLLPALIFAALLATFVCLTAVCYLTLPPFAVFLVGPAVAFSLSMTAVLAAAIVKWVLIGTFKPTVKPLWCSYVWRNEIVNSVYESLAANAMSPLLGTPFVAPCLRLMGCEIGRWVYLQTTLFSEFDLVKIGDFASLNLGVTIQTHLFEDRVMKAESLEIGRNCTIGNMSVVLYGVIMQPGSRLGPMSLLMKGETISASTRWHGIPTEQLRLESKSNENPTTIARVA
jgi:non-ribosomal peptide synthetase-like protein